MSVLSQYSLALFLTDNDRNEESYSYNLFVVELSDGNKSKKHSDYSEHGK